MVVLHTNILSARAGSALQQNQKRSAQAIERLSTGLRINRAVDDPSGLIAATQLSSEITTLAAQQSGDDRLYLKAALAGGILEVASDVLRQARGIVLENANSAAVTDEKLGANQMMLDAIIDGLERIGINSTFMGQALFADTVSTEPGPQRDIPRTTLSPHVTGSVTDSQSMESFTLADLRSGGQLADNVNPEMAAKVIDEAIKQIASQRSDLGNFQHSLVSMGNVRQNTIYNLSDALSRIQDTDFAVETASLARGQMLSNTASATMAIANVQPRTALRLL